MRTSSFLCGVVLALAGCSSEDSQAPVSRLTAGPGEEGLTAEPGDGIDGDSDPGDDPGDSADPAALAADEGDRAPFDGPLVRGEVDDDVEALTDDEVVIPQDARPELADGTPQVVYVNFGGPVVRSCSAFCDVAATNHSSLVGSYFKRSSIDFLPYTSTLGRRAIVKALRSYYAPYDVTVTTTRPTSGPYTMAVISPSAVGPTTKRGISFLDCKDAMRTNVAFVFRIKGVSAATIARYAAHEIGHSLGLMHVKGTSEIMQYASSGSHFGSSTLDVAKNPVGYSCIPGQSVQNAPLLLRESVGLRP